MPTRPRLLLMSHDVPESVVEFLQQSLEVTVMPGSPEALLANIADYDAFWGHFGMKVDRAALERGKPRLRAVCTASTGTDHIDVAAAQQLGIRVLCIKNDYGLLNSFTATAECAWMLLLACQRHFRRANAQVMSMRWGYDYFGHQLSGKTLGVVGVGRLGSMVVEYGKAFRMRVLGCDPKPVQIAGVEQVDLDTLLRQSDCISLHVHLRPETRHMIDAAAIAKMKRGAVLINTARGDLVDEQAVIAALQSGQLAAFGADTIHDEWAIPTTGSDLIRYAQAHDNVVITPHFGGGTVESITAARQFMAKKVVQFLQTGEELTWP
jgi:D-3-phosphoglycerate dehydrogenase